MDRALKERVIGAIALVAIAVLVVPVFLDGPSTEAEIVSESVTLPGQNEQSRKRQTIVLERDRDQPVPVSSRSPQATTAAEKLAADDAARKAAAARADPAAAESPPSGDDTPAAVPAEKAPPTTVAKAAGRPGAEAPPKTTVAKADVTPAAAAAAESTTGMWAVQLGSFSNQANAERLAADLRESGYAAFLSQLSTSSGSLHRVRVGPQKDRESAEAVAGKLNGAGHKGQVVPHP
jgi:DedD protein